VLDSHILFHSIHFIDQQSYSAVIEYAGDLSQTSTTLVTIQTVLLPVIMVLKILYGIIDIHIVPIINNNLKNKKSNFPHQMESKFLHQVAFFFI
jgi:hypothetical protein